MFIEIDNLNEKVKVELSPSVEYSSNCTLMDFPDVNFSSAMGPIYHTIKVISSLDLIREEYELTETVDEQFSEKYWINKEEDKIILAKLVITEFPNEWKEQIDESWAYWLDALDGDHAVIGSRADEILERGIYDDDLFEFGSLFYVKDLEIHHEFNSSKFAIDLLRFTFGNLIRDRTGILFVIPQERIIGEIDKEWKNETKKLIDFYEKSGFTRAFNSINEDVVMEIDLRAF
ncbi:hypothetical protein [Paenibacillus monticola]|uniref:Uncharacterized protein n=1 Tax=Paenibacillus monticola TaxID=2666075 RepID=A0A7X2HAX9_9BACL|nr:hypothetical protein [Paenibacillus monticola]MRN56744.1 hypothetical protein [Paenibacillus monticola]